MYSLNNYKEQCYNPGSPQPSPSQPPLRSLPKQTPALLDDFEFSILPSKIPKIKPPARKPTTKRKLDNTEPSEPNPSPPKKSNMMNQNKWP